MVSMKGLMIFPCGWEKVRMSILTTPIQHYTGGPTQQNKTRK